MKTWSRGIQALFKGTGSQLGSSRDTGSNSSMSGWTIITPHFDTGPNREQVFGPISALYLSVCREGHMCVCTHVCVADEECIRTCVLVSVCGLCLSLSWLAMCQYKCDSRHFIMGRVCHIHHCYACSSVPVCQCVFTLSHIVHVLL